LQDPEQLSAALKTKFIKRLLRTAMPTKQTSNNGQMPSLAEIKWSPVRYRYRIYIEISALILDCKFCLILYMHVYVCLYADVHLCSLITLMSTWLCSAFCSDLRLHSLPSSHIRVLSLSIHISGIVATFAHCRSSLRPPSRSRRRTRIFVLQRLGRRFADDDQIGGGCQSMWCVSYIYIQLYTYICRDVCECF
jgi:hypothetical protein